METISTSYGFSDDWVQLAGKSERVLRRVRSSERFCSGANAPSRSDDLRVALRHFRSGRDAELRGKTHRRSSAQRAIGAF